MIDYQDVKIKDDTRVESLRLQKIVEQRLIEAEE